MCNGCVKYIMLLMGKLHKLNTRPVQSLSRHLFYFQQFDSLMQWTDRPLPYIIYCPNFIITIANIWVTKIFFLFWYSLITSKFISWYSNFCGGHILKVAYVSLGLCAHPDFYLFIYLFIFCVILPKFEPTLV